MSELLSALRRLCLLRIGPQDLPWSPALLGMVLGLNVTVDVLTGVLIGKPGLAMAASLISLAVILGGVWLLLRMRQFEARFVQTALALVMAALLFTILSLPLQLMLMPMPLDPATINDTQMLAMLLAAGLGGWSLAVAGHILRHALERSFMIGLLLALMLNLASVAFVQLLLPAGGQALGVS